MISILILLFLFELINAAQAIWPSPRTYTECVYVSTEATIYCLGGDIETCAVNSTSTSDKGDNSNAGSDHGLQSPRRNSTELFYSLDVNRDLDLSLLQDSWKVININFIPHKHFTMSALTGRTLDYIVASGGYIGNKNRKETYTTGIYDISLGFWTLQDRATNREGDRPLIYGHSATVSSDETLIYTSGGIINGDKEFGTNISALPSASLPVNNLNVFDAKERVWRFDPKPNPEYDEYVRQFHKAVLGNDDVIYFIGGYAPDGHEEHNGVYNLSGLSMNRMSTYDTKVGKWSVTDIHGDFYPFERIHHSATLLPSKNQILVFGGMDTSTGEALHESNFCIFDINSMKWERQDLDQEDPNNNNSAITKGHYGHSAIIAEPYLFIMFGSDHNHKATNNTWVIDTRSWKWVTSISKVEPAPPNKGRDDENDDDENDDNEAYTWPEKDSTFDGHSVGAMIGAVVGAMSFTALVVVGLYLKKKKRKQLKSTTLPTEAEEPTVALHNNRNSLDNVINDSNSIASVTDSLPPYRLHDGDHQLPRIDAIGNTTSS